ncbi:monocarboxylate transporter 6-like [Strongylocentrotus purpuratus]|uniref:Major facilitator superfamily (MFS) profile domain-containing protein n=1 Tax=Strongylocentrotus purpuratus TaxID=7668 RepID=A0A7M7PC51_STRPU|nr:monocarboxylate transporter 6-like [Strongylocentrotus purpuratus]
MAYHIGPWKIVPALFLQTCFFLATIKSIGVYFPELRRDLGITATDLGITLGIFEAFSFVPGSFVAILNHKHGIQRPLIIGGAILASVGLISSSLVGTSAQLSICLAASGLGINIMSITLGIALSEQSGDRFDLLFGIGKSGYSLGMSVFPLLAEYLKNIYGWRGSLIIIGAIMANIIPLVLLVETDKGLTERGAAQGEEKNPSMNDVNDNSEQETADQSQQALITRDEEYPVQSDNNSRCSKNNCSSLYKLLADSVFNRDRCLVVILTAYTIFSMVDAGWHAFLIPRAVRRGLPTSRALYLAYTAAVACFIGRCLSGMILKPKFITAHDWHMVLTIINALSLIADVCFPHFAVMIVTSFVTALTIGEMNILMVVICRDRAPLPCFPVILVASEIIFGVGAFIGTTLTGLAADNLGYNEAFLLLAGFECLVLCIMMSARCSKRSPITD